MKSTFFLLVLIQVLLITPSDASNFLVEFERFKASANDAEIQAFLSKCEKAEQSNPDYYATAGNYWWQLSQKVSITTKPADKNDISVADEKSGAQVGSISTVGKTNPDIPKKALDLLVEGGRRFPERADIALGLAHVQKEMGLQSEHVQTLIKLLEFASKDLQSLRWKMNDHLPREAKLLLPEAVQGFSADLYQEESAECDALCAKLCDATIAVFPDHPFAYNIKAALASASGHKKEALALLKTAHTKAPDDALILLNLGDAYKTEKQFVEAQEYYAKVLKIKDLDDSVQDQARAAIRDIEQAVRENSDQPRQ